MRVGGGSRLFYREGRERVGGGGVGGRYSEVLLLTGVDSGLWIRSSVVSLLSLD